MGYKPESVLSALLLAALQKGSWEEARTDCSQRFSAWMHMKINWEAFKTSLVPRPHPGEADLIELSFGLGISMF